ncbi:MAG TPA: hypothetical protein VEG32_04305 [Clostridia bacterium]|nr:hypothetical protein [Clostridia bacterium]
MHKAVSVAFVVMGMAFLAVAAGPPPAAEPALASISESKLGPHASGGRGCSGCHAPHSATVGNAAGLEDDDDLWSLNIGPLYGANEAPADFDASSTDTFIPLTVADAEVRGIMMCLSCHDGQMAKGAMVTAASYEGSAGFPVVAPVLSSSGVVAPNYIRAHPVGPRATLGSVGLDSHVQLKAGGCLESGVVVPCLEVKPSALAYRSFVESYGSPSVTFGHSNPVGIPEGALDASEAFVTCTSCHTPHTMHGFKSSAALPIANKADRVFPSHFFIAAPYNPDVQPSPNEASSATQFCRQCHFSDIGANEQVGVITVKTRF